MIYVPGYGNSSAKIMRIGEGPGKHEEEQGRAFVGPTGNMVNDLTHKAGIEPEDCYDTNVVKIRPPDNNIKRLKELGKSIEDFLPQLKQEILTINPNVILAFGDTALTALTGQRGIKKYRGSILSCTLTDTSYPKVIPTIHPASILHGDSDGGMMSWRDLAYIQLDVNRAVFQSTFKEFRLPQRNLHIAKSSLDFYRFMDRHKGKDEITFDIETFKTIPQCISFAFTRHEAISLPLFNIMSSENPTGIGISDLSRMWKDAAEVLRDPNFKKGGQNLKFDQARLEEHLKIKVEGVYFDTMLAFHTLYPELFKSLAFQASILTDEPFYKDEGSEYNPEKDRPERLYLYNAKDSAVEREVQEVEYEEMQELGLLDFFFERMMPLHTLYYDMENNGILTDKEIREILKKKYSQKDEENDAELEKLCGFLPNVNSPKQIGHLLYEDLKIPLRKNTGERTLMALMNNVVKDFNNKEIIRLILKGRKIKKTIGTYIEAAPDEDGRMRTQFRITGTETGRTSTSICKAPVRSDKRGIAFQTLTKYGEVGPDLRSMFIPDAGMIFMEPDLSQAEARIVMLLAKDDEAIRLFDTTDIHRVTAGWIFDKKPEDVFDTEVNQERQIGKKVRHAGNYDMGKHEFMEFCAGEGIFLSEWKCGKLLEKFHSNLPSIIGVFHAEIIQALEDSGQILINPFGRRRQFFDRWGKELWKEAYAQIPQSTISDQLKFAMIRIKKRIPFIKYLSESHDSFLAMIPWQDRTIRITAQIIKEELETPIDFSKCSLPRHSISIPTEFKISTTNWQDMRKYVLD